MKQLNLILTIFFLFHSSYNYAQTKKIALRSHSGSNTTFTIYVPDDFGLGRSQEEEWRVKQAAMNRAKKDTTNCSTLEPVSIEYLDPSAYCTPQNNQALTISVDSTIQLNHNSKVDKPLKSNKKDTVATPINSTPSNSIIPPVDSTKNLENQPLKKEVPEEGSMGFLMLLLTIPAFFAVVLEFFSSNIFRVV